MELDRIEKLMEKYFEATTTVAEEEKLKEYFTKEGVAPHLEQYKPMFAFFSEARTEQFNRQVPLKTRRSYYQWISIAAVAVLMLGLYFGKQVHDQREAEYAYQETRKAFGLIAQNLDRGTEKVAYLNEFEETKQKIYKNN
ncbi:hypothetical protein ACT6NV_00305 [Robiginitalea sp. IMCC44478]|uniref:hypothetical protein n=1 Tax=Robiginitalea sp. IMCC44478 TaxID=3459122 RepID=UPI004042D822